MKFGSGVCLCALAAIAVPVFADNVPPKQPGRWAQDYVGRKADPDVRFGTLPNGLRYAIMHNETPHDGVAMRMRIGAGSLEERDEEQGLAHFLEHMAFRGSKNVADGDVVHMLERQGLRFGPDTNAFTMQEQTVYMFNFPHADATALDTGFNLFREIGERLTIDPKLVDSERGVVLSEERLRDTPPYRSIKANFGNSLAGTRGVARWPIGQVDMIKAATSERLRRFYRANYRPDNATIIVVGNVDPLAVEKQIEAGFSDWKPAGRPDPLTIGTPVPTGPAAEFVAPGTIDNLSLTWARPLDMRAPTEALDRETVTRWIGLIVLNQRLSDRSLKPGCPFVAAGGGMMPSQFASASMTQIGIQAEPGKWHEAMDAVIEEQRGLLEGGIQPAELQRAVTTLRTQMQAAVAAAKTRQDAAIADQLVSAANNGNLYTSAEQDLALMEPIFASLTPQEATAALRDTFSGAGPVLFRSAQNSPAGTPTLASALDSAYARPLTKQAAMQAVVWPYGEVGASGRIVTQIKDTELGATLVKFANGARLIVKPTSFEKDKVYVNVAFGDGRIGAAPKLVHALWATQFMVIGGTGKLPLDQIQSWAQTSGKMVSANVNAGTTAFTLGAVTRSEDLASEMQLLAAYARDPGFRPEMGSKIAAIGPMISGQIDANAGAVFWRAAQKALTGTDGRLSSTPSAEDIAATSGDDLPRLLHDALGQPADVTIVGDVTVEDAIRLTAATFAAGPAVARAAPASFRVTMPVASAEPLMVTHGGRADQAFYGSFWQLPDYFADPKASYAADVAAAILQTRLIDTVREKLGITYTPSVGAYAAPNLPGFGYFNATIETPQGNFETFRTLLADQLHQLAGQPVGSDELQRAKKPLIEAATKDLENDGWWTNNLSQMLRDPRMKQPILMRTANIEAVSAADVQALLTRFVTNRQPLTVIAKAKQ
jgi:zinc protease